MKNFRKFITLIFTVAMLTVYSAPVFAVDIAVAPPQGGAGIENALQSGNVLLSAGVYYCSADINVPAGRTLTGVYDANDPRNPAKNSILYFETTGSVNPGSNTTISDFSIIGAGFVRLLNVSNVTCEDLYITHRDLSGNNLLDVYLPVAFWCIARDNDISNITYNRCVAEYVNGHGWFHDDRVGGEGEPPVPNHWINGLTITNCRASYTGQAFIQSGGVYGYIWDGSGFTFQERNKLANAYISNCVADHTLISGFHQEGSGMFDTDEDGIVEGAENILIENCRSSYSGLKGSMPENPLLCGDDIRDNEWWTFGGFTITANATVRDCTADHGWMNFMGWWSQNITAERFHSSYSIGAGYLLCQESGCNVPNSFTDCESVNDGKCALDLYAGANNTFTNFTIRDCQAASGWQILANGCTDAGFWGNLYAYPYINSVNCHIIDGGPQIAKCFDSTDGSSLVLTGDAVGTYTQSPFSGAVDRSAFTIVPDELLVNPGFENGLTNWTNYGNCTLTAVTSPVSSGNYSCRVSNRRNNWTGPVQNIKDILLSNGQGNYNIEAMLRTASGTQNMALRICLVDNNGYNYFDTPIATIGSSSFSKVSAVRNLVWSGTLQDAYIYTESEAGRGNYYVDDISLKKE